MMRRVVLIPAVCLVALVSAAGRMLAAAAPAEAANAEASARGLHSKLVEAAGKGRLDDRILDLFRRFTTARIRGQWVPGRLSEPFWKWVLGHEVLCDAVLIGVHPVSEKDLRILDHLATLRRKFPNEVESYPHLAMAFAVVYGAAGKEPIRDRHLGWVAKGREIPSMVDSFRDYVTHAGTMKIPLEKMPWPLLLFVADNDLPLEERQWVRGRYGDTPLEKCGRIYYDLEYDYDEREGNAKIGDRPKTMANLRKYGGVCSDRAYYASRVLKTFGVPALYDVGEGERGGHAWLAYFGTRRAARYRPAGGKGAGLLFVGRFDYDRYYTGAVWDPKQRAHVLDRDVQLDVAAVMHSYRGYLDTLAACYVYAMFDDEQRPGRTGLLEGAVKRNPYCAAPWRIVAAEAASGNIPAKRGEQMYQSMLRQFGEYPDLTFWVLNKILGPRLAAAGNASRRDISNNLQILGKAYQLYAKAERPDLAVKLRCLQGKYLEAVGRSAEALRMYVTASERYLAQHFGFVDLYDRAVRLMQDTGKADLMLAYMERVVEKVPPYQSEENRRFNEVNPTYDHVVKRYAEALRVAGRSAEADRQLSALEAKKKEE